MPADAAVEAIEQQRLQVSDPDYESSRNLMALTRQLRRNARQSRPDFFGVTNSN